MVVKNGKFNSYLRYTTIKNKKQLNSRTQKIKNKKLVLKESQIY